MNLKIRFHVNTSIILLKKVSICVPEVKKKGLQGRDFRSLACGTCIHIMIYIYLLLSVRFMIYHYHYYRYDPSYIYIYIYSS